MREGQLQEYSDSMNGYDLYDKQNEKPIFSLCIIVKTWKKLPPKTDKIWHKNGWLGCESDSDCMKYCSIYFTVRKLKYEERH